MESKTNNEHIASNAVTQDQVLEAEIAAVKNTITTYRFNEIKSKVEAALAAGRDPNDILDLGMIAAMDEIGEGFKNNKVYMPQMLIAAKTMQSGLEVLKPHLGGRDHIRKGGKAIVGSVEGDVHDIGKNLVSLMMEGSGMDVVDLGADVPASKFKEAMDSNPDATILACSSSMTTTRESLKDVVDMTKSDPSYDRFVVMVGGATMDQMFSTEISADIYTADAASAAQRAKQIMEGMDKKSVSNESRMIAEENMRRRDAPSVDASEERGEPRVRRHLVEAMIRGRVGHGDTKPLTIRENFEETMKRDRGMPDRYVNQYGFMGFVFDPIVTNSACLHLMLQGAPEYVDGWGITNVTPKGMVGSHPLHGNGYTKIPDPRRWEENLTPAPLDYPQSAWNELKPQIKAVDDAGLYRAIVMAQGLFERVHYNLGMEESLVAFYEYPDECHAIIDVITEWEIESIDRTFANIEPDILFHHDDWGTALNSFMDPGTHREFFLEPYKRIYSHFKSLGGKYVVHHSDSYAANLTQTFIDVGVDVWQGPIDGNNIPDLIDEYGDRLTFMGAIDNGVVDMDTCSREHIRAYVEKQCDKHGTVSFIPCLTRGLNLSMTPGVYEYVTEVIDEVSKRKF